MKAVAFIPGSDLKTEMRRVLLHAGEKGYTLVGLAVGERSWPGAQQMYTSGEVQVIVTTTRATHTSEPGVEICGAGRLTLRTPARATRLRRIADLVDSGLSDAAILKILRSN